MFNRTTPPPTAEELQYLHVLSPRQRRVLLACFGLLDTPPRTVRELARELGVYFTAIAQIRDRAITLLRRAIDPSLAPKRTRRPPDTRTICRHCGTRPARYYGGRVQCRGLCRRCYADTDIRDAHPSLSPFARRGVTGGKDGRPLPLPTSAPPGSPGKVAELSRRARQGLQLWHPLDAIIDAA